ncbi:MAG: site-specific integrase [Oscillospiraceae bacterium]|nr:site-specific integrase [Oscillospiraceae bacterium]
MSRLTTRWYPPEGWSQKAIERELTKVSVKFEQDCKSGMVLSRSERKAYEEEQKKENAKIKTFKQYCEAVFMAELGIRCSENTRFSYQTMLDTWIYPAFGDLKISEITAATISALLVSMQAAGKSHATLIKCYGVLLGVFKKAYINDVISSNPMGKVERPKMRKGETKTKEAEAYTASEVKHILSCLESEPLKWKVFVNLLIDTGMRRGECCGLQWKNIDFKRNLITISNNLCYTPQKGVYLDTPKNGKSRTVDVDPSIIKMLRELRQEQVKKAFSSFVFTQEGSCEPMHPQSPTRYFAKFAKKKNINHFHPHKLRHSFASIAITNGADVASVSEKIGHSDKAVTLRMYTHADEESIKRASEIYRESIRMA